MAHELTHAWQYKRFGPGYIDEALNDSDFDGDNETYEFRNDLEARTAFLDMEPEAQASLIETIYAAIALPRPGDAALELTPASFNEALLDDGVDGLPIPINGISAEFEIVPRAHAIVRS